jgi:NAD(P)-dependent dehydrogenase (short-subunit alcohol dehydrogenase family)
MSKPLADRIALVTGASRGIGAATALKLAEAGAHVVAVARTVGGLEELDDAIRAAGGSATLVPGDLKDFAAIDRLATALDERYGRLDVLVGNAGILGSLSPLGHVQPKAWDDVLAVNVTANWRLIRALDPLLQRSAGARVVFLTSGVASRAIAYWGPYAVSKAALEMLARIYAAENATTNVRVNLFNPGPIRTRMRAQAMPGEDPMTLATPDQAAEKVVALCLPSFNETGKLYNFPTASLMEFRPPAAVGEIANSE